VILKREVKLTIEILQGALSEDDEFLININDSKLAKETIHVSSHFLEDAYEENQQYPHFLEFLDNYQMGKFTKDLESLLEYAKIGCLLPT
jgi:hypothetical protein